MQTRSGEVAEFGSHGAHVKHVGSEPLDHPLVVSVPEAARLIGMGKSKFWQLIWSGDIPHVRRGRWVGVPVDELRNWIRKNTN
jgi:excisionase family DNA binding protein